MKLAIISDIHDHIQNLNKALALPEMQGTQALLCCGDLCSPFIVKLLGQGYSNPIHIVLGNNDGDVAAIIENASGFGHIAIHGEYFRSEFGGKSIAMNHYPEKARVLAENGGYDIVCYGHNHTRSTDRTVRNTLLLNPGPIMGYHGGKLEPIPATFLIVETDHLTTETFTI